MFKIKCINMSETIIWTDWKRCLKPNIYYFLNLIKDDNSHFKKSTPIVPMNIHKNIPAS